MKKIIIAMLLLFPTVALCQDGVVFHSMSMAEALAKAVKEQKCVFVDCYTSWCGPCRKMTADVFPQKVVGDYFNPRFIAVKYDIEKDADGKKLAADNSVTVIPTYLVFRADGSLLHKFSGAFDAQTFLKKVEESFDDDKAYGSLRKMYEEGGRSKEFLGLALKSFTSVRDPKSQEAVAQLVLQLSDKEKTSADYWFIYSTDVLTPKGSDNEKFLFDNAAAFRKSVGHEDVDKILVRHYKDRLMDIIGLKETITTKDMKKMAGQINKLRLESVQQLGSYVKIANAVLGGELGEVISVSVAEIPSIDPASNVYFAITDRVFADGTKEQKQKWIKLGEELRDKLPEDKRNLINAIIQWMQQRI